MWMFIKSHKHILLSWPQVFSLLWEIGVEAVALVTKQIQSAFAKLCSCRLNCLTQKRAVGQLSPVPLVLKTY